LQEAVIWYGAGRLIEAERANRRAVRLDPDSYTAHDNLAFVLFDRERVAEALGHWRAPAEAKGETVIRSDPAHPVADPFDGRFGAHDYRALVPGPSVAVFGLHPRRGRPPGGVRGAAGPVEHLVDADSGGCCRRDDGRGAGHPGQPDHRDARLLTPRPHWLLFDSDRSGVTQVYRMPVEGGEPEQLTSDSSASFWARYSPDGRLISFHQYTENGRRLFVMGADGGTPTRLETGPGDAFAAEWSRDGRGLFYLRDYGTPTARLALLPRSASGTWAQPTNLLTLDVLSPTPSPDGRWLAFGSVNGFMIATPRGDSVRVVVPGGYRSRAEKATIATWSDDGRTMYYLARDSLDRATVWAIDPLKGGPRLLVRFGPPGHDWHRYGFRSWRGRFYFTSGEREGNLWSTTVEAER
jgi:hypothetical protein